MLETIGLILSTIITAVASVYAVVLQNRASKLKVEVTDLKNELIASSEAFRFDLNLTNDLNQSITDIFANTSADRVLIFRGYNGKSKIRIVSCIFERHKDLNDKTFISIGATTTYKKYEPDTYYLKWLEEVERRNIISLQTKDMPDCDLKDFYTVENVQDTYLFFINRINIDNDNDEIYFGSIATHKTSFKLGAFGIIKANISNIRETLNQLYNTR